MLFIVLFSLVSSAIASTVDVQTVRIDGSNSEVSLALRAEETRTEYRYETRPATCWRTVVENRRVCRPTPQGGTVCHNEQYVRQIPYTCYQQVRVPYEVFENHVQASLQISFGAVPEGFRANEVVKATLRGDQLTLSSTGSKTLVLELTELQETRRMSGNIEMITVFAEVKFHDAAAVRKALVMSKASVQKNVLSYTLGPIAGVQIGHNLKIVDAPLLGSSTVLFNGDAGTALARSERAGGTDMRVAFKDVLGRDLGKGRYNIEAKAFFKAGISVLNDAELGGLSVEKGVLYKIR